WPTIFYGRRARAPARFRTLGGPVASRPDRRTAHIRRASPPSFERGGGRWKAAHPNTYRRLGLPIIGKPLGHGEHRTLSISTRVRSHRRPRAKKILSASRRGYYPGFGRGRVFRLRRRRGKPFAPGGMMPLPPVNQRLDVAA